MKVIVLFEIILADDGGFSLKDFADLFELLESIRAVRIIIGDNVNMLLLYEEVYKCKGFKAQYIQIESKNAVEFILFNRRHKEIVAANCYGQLGMRISSDISKVAFKISKDETVIGELSAFELADHITQLTFGTTDDNFDNELLEALITLALRLFDTDNFNQINVFSTKTSFILRKSSDSIEVEVKISSEPITLAECSSQYYYDKLSEISGIFKIFDVEICIPENVAVVKSMEEYKCPTYVTHLKFATKAIIFDAEIFEELLTQAKSLLNRTTLKQIDVSLGIVSVLVRKLHNSYEYEVKHFEGITLPPHESNYYTDQNEHSTFRKFKVEVIIYNGKALIEVADKYESPDYVTHLTFRAPGERFGANAIDAIIQIAENRLDKGKLKYIGLISWGISVNIRKLGDLLGIEVEFTKEITALPNLDRNRFYRVILSAQLKNREIELCNKLKDVVGVRFLDIKGEKQIQRFVGHLPTLPLPEESTELGIEITKKPYTDLEMISGPICSTCIDVMEFIGNHFPNFRSFYIETTETIYPDGLRRFYHLTHIGIVDEFVCNASADPAKRTGYCFFFWNKELWW